MATEGSAGGVDRRARDRFVAGLLGALVALAVFGSLVYVAWPRGGPPSQQGHSMFVAGVVALDSGAPVVGATVQVRSEDGAMSAQGITGEDGLFNIGLDPVLPTRVLAEVTYRRPIGPSVTGFRWSPLLSTGGAVDVGRVVLPDPASKRLTKGGSTATSADGSIVVEDLPPEVASVWAGSYDPDATPDVFPGDLAERRELPLNSVVFVWISALDSADQPVVTLSQPATVRMRVPEAQWVDAEDLEPGNGVIDTPIYSLDYATAYWERQPDGRLTDATGAPIDEAFESSIRRGGYSGEVYAEFSAGHFSWWNVDKPPKICAGEYGDAPDPPYPTNAASGGVYHRDMCRAWLGAWVDADFTAQVPDRDIYDDGLLAVKPLKVRVANWNHSGDLYLNALLDRNDDGDFGDADEWIVQNLRISVPEGKYKVVETSADVEVEAWVRLTLTGEAITDYDGHGTFAIGETEDYRFVPKHPVSVYIAGDGNVTSDPPGIDCGEYRSGDCYEEFRTGEVVALAAAPKPGESFLYWGSDCSFAGSNPICRLTMGQGKLSYSVTARFSEPPPPPPPLQYVLVVNVYGNGTVRADPPGFDCRSAYGCSVWYDPGTVVNLTATPDANETFLGWGWDCRTSGTQTVCTVVMDQHRIVSATFSQAFFELFVYASGNGSVSSDPPGIDCRPGVYAGCYGWFRAGTIVTLTATPEGSAIFQTWTADCKAAGTNPVCTLTMNGGKRAGAAFTQSTLDLYVYVAGNGTVTSDPPGIDCRQRNFFDPNETTECHAWFSMGAWVNLTATPDPGESFLGWGAQCEPAGTSPRCTVVVGELPHATYVFASFTQSYYVLDVYVSGNGTVTSLPPGIDCRGGDPTGGNQSKRGPCSAAFQKNTNVTLTATPDANETFLGWGGACAYAGTNATCVVYMDANKWVYAQFTYPPRLYVYGSGNNTGRGWVRSAPPGIECFIPRTYNGTERCDARFGRGTDVTLTATPEPGYVFVAWYGSCTGASPTCTVTMDGDKFVYARFA